MASQEYFDRKVVEQMYGGGTSSFDPNLTHEQQMRLNVIKAYYPTVEYYNPDLLKGGKDEGAIPGYIFLGGLVIYLIHVITDFIDRSPKSLLILLAFNIIAFTLSIRFLYRTYAKKKQVKRKKLYLTLSWIFLLLSGSILTLFVVLCFKGVF